MRFRNPVRSLALRTLLLAAGLAATPLLAAAQGTVTTPGTAAGWQQQLKIVAGAAALRISSARGSGDDLVVEASRQAARLPTHVGEHWRSDGGRALTWISAGCLMRTPESAAGIPNVQLWRPECRSVAATPAIDGSLLEAARPAYLDLPQHVSRAPASLSAAR